MRIKLLALPVVASLALLAGCTDDAPTPQASPTPTTNGVENLTAEEIVEAAVDALNEADSYRVTGSGESDGETVEVDMVIAGDQQQGTLDVGLFAMEIRVTADAGYFKADEAFWSTFVPEEVADEVLPLLVNAWVLVPTEQASAFGFTAEDFLAPEGTLTKGSVTTYKGTRAIEVKDDEGATLFVSIEGEPYPLALQQDEGTIEFVDIDKAVTVEAPPADEIVDLEEVLTDAMGG
jgi:hypothetical protein